MRSSANLKKIIKDVYKGSNIINVVLVLVTLMICVVVGMTFLLPSPDAKWVYQEGENVADGIKADISLKDSFLFAWHRPHVEAVIFKMIIVPGSTPPFQLEIFSVGDPADGTAINLAGIILLICVGVVLLLAIPCCIVSMVSFKHWKSNQILSVMLWVNTLFLCGLVANAIANQSAAWMSHFVQMGLDGTKLDADIFHYEDNGSALSSIMVSYTLIGRITVSAIAAMLGAGGMALCFGASQRYSKVKKIVDVNTDKTIIVTDGVIA